jgi:hypothetical protein
VVETPFATGDPRWLIIRVTEPDATSCVEAKIVRTVQANAVIPAGNDRLRTVLFVSNETTAIHFTTVQTAFWTELEAVRGSNVASISCRLSGILIVSQNPIVGHVCEYNARTVPYGPFGESMRSRDFLKSPTHTIRFRSPDDNLSPAKS